MSARPTHLHGSRLIAVESVCTHIIARSSPRTIVLLFGLLLAFAPAFLALDRALGGVTPPEATFGYSAEQAYRAFDAEGEGGRRAHLIFEVVDLFMIPVYALLYASTIAYAARRLFGQGTRLAPWGVVIPLLAGLVDYGEDAVLMALLLAYPQPMDGLARIAGALTVTKWLLVSAGCALAVLGLLGSLGQALLHRCRRRNSRRHDARRPELPRPPSLPGTGASSTRPGRHGRPGFTRTGFTLRDPIVGRFMQHWVHARPRGESQEATGGRV